MNLSSKKNKYQLVDLHILYNNYFISFIISLVHYVSLPIQCMLN